MANTISQMKKSKVLLAKPLVVKPLPGDKNIGLDPVVCFYEIEYAMTRYVNFRQNRTNARRNVRNVKSSNTPFSKNRPCNYCSSILMTYVS